MELTKTKNENSKAFRQKCERRGFTLIELLIVISILGILAGTIVLIINPADLLKQANDAKRLSDLDTIAKAINIAIADEEITLTTGSWDSINQSQSLDGTGWVGFSINTGATGLAKYLSVLPIDPVNAASGGITYNYQFAADGTNFELNAKMESSKNVSKMTTDGGDNATSYEVGTDPGLDLIN